MSCSWVGCLNSMENDQLIQLLMKNYEFFGAPHAGFLSYPETMHRANAIDLGIFLQTLMLLFVERGIYGCPQGALAAYPGPVKAMLPAGISSAIDSYSCL